MPCLNAKPAVGPQSPFLPPYSKQSCCSAAAPRHQRQLGCSICWYTGASEGPSHCCQDQSCCSRHSCQAVKASPPAGSPTSESPPLNPYTLHTTAQRAHPYTLTHYTPHPRESTPKPLHITHRTPGALLPKPGSSPSLFPRPPFLRPPLQTPTRQRQQPANLQPRPVPRSRPPVALPFLVPSQVLAQPRVLGAEAAAPHPGPGQGAGWDYVILLSCQCPIAQTGRAGLAHAAVGLQPPVCGGAAHKPGEFARQALRLPPQAALRPV